ncbi:MAG: ATP-binding protein [Bryobacterales bacterium]|nr:ATP-binding protein [Bryobacterales bacterium]
MLDETDSLPPYSADRLRTEKRVTARIFFKLIGALLCLLIVAMTAVDFLSVRVAERNYTQTLTDELVNYGKVLSLRNPDVVRIGRDEAKAVGDALDARVTVIGSTGRVLMDTEADPASMENHAARQEIKAALEGRVGAVTRTSPTLGIRFHYVAIPVEGGALRFAVPLSEVQTRVNTLRLQILAAAALSFLPAILLAAFFARLVSAKLGRIIDYSGELARGNFKARLQKMGKDELGILSRKLNETGENLERMFNELEREHAELEKVERIRKDFVINVSHELRTPLAAIQGYSETLLDGALDDPENNVRFVKIIRQNAERLTSLTADLLTLSRLELKRQEFQFASYRVKDLLEDTVDTLRPTAARNDIRLELTPLDDGQEVFCDREAFFQMLSNLVDNAVKYSPPGATVKIVASELPEDGQNFVQLAVSDAGIGIPEEDLPRLFERFYRVDKARSRELGGTGLGLSIVKHLALAHNGRVRVSSEIGRGSTFYVLLPMEDLSAEISVESHRNVTII